MGILYRCPTPASRSSLSVSDQFFFHISHISFIDPAVMVLLRELGLVAFLAMTHSASAFYSKNGGVLNLDEKSFKKEIMLSEHAAVRI